MELCRGEPSVRVRPKRKILFLALAVCIAFSVVFAGNLAAVDIDHDCTGENCPVCLHIETAKGFLKTLKTTGSFTSLTSHLVFTAKIPENNAECNIYPHSPIALKVRFNS
jgi:hypothetical protein